jgi:hypothetical protein
MPEVRAAVPVHYVDYSVEGVEMVVRRIAEQQRVQGRTKLPIHSLTRAADQPLVWSRAKHLRSLKMMEVGAAAGGEPVSALTHPSYTGVYSERLERGERRLSRGR